ncbi:UNVERIFIED_CONTAM: WD repeat and FYVE domain-containing protein 3 [Trichonephila clavipes]
MNIMRKLLVGHSRGAAMGEDPPQSTQHTALGLMHLHKLFSEFAHPPHPLSQTEQEQRLYNMLPLFCKYAAADSYFIGVSTIFGQGAANTRKNICL